MLVYAQCKFSKSMESADTCDHIISKRSGAVSTKKKKNIKSIVTLITLFAINITLGFHPPPPQKKKATGITVFNIKIRPYIYCIFIKYIQ